MIRLGAIFIIILLSSCSTKEFRESPLIEHYEGQLQLNGPSFRYQQAVWYAAEPEHEMILDGRTLYIYHFHPDEDPAPVYAWVNFSDCSGLEELIEDMRNSVIPSISQMVGLAPETQPEVLVLDGDWMLLDYHGSMSGSVQLKGSSSSYYVVPWVKAAQSVYSRGYKCAEVNK
jgi:hypothetical protein